MKKVQIFFGLLLFSKLCFGQEYILPNEEVIFSFETKKGKKMVLAKDKDNEYIIYRFGTENKIELEYPEKNKESWSKFSYFYYGKPGGPENNGMYCHSVNFKIDDYSYSIYSNLHLYEEGDENNIGIIINNEKRGKRKKIEAYQSIEGTLDDFLDNNLLKFEDIENYE